MVWRAAVVALAGVLGVALPAPGASSLRLSEPPGFGEVESATLDTEGIPLGPARVTLRRDPAGRVLLESQSTIVGGDSVRLSALLEPLADGALRLVEQRSVAVDREGVLLVDMEIDHVTRRATCVTPDGRKTLELPQADRVANVPINLLLLPLARGEVERLAFQALVCRGGDARLVDISARRTGRVVRSPRGGSAVEIEYEVQLGALLASLARPFLPRMLFWIDPAAAPDPLVAQQLPLYPKGPTVLVVRRELPPDLFLAP